MFCCPGNLLSIKACQLVNLLFVQNSIVKGQFAAGLKVSMHCWALCLHALVKMSPMLTSYLWLLCQN